jgi:anti-anti-sigma factor
MEQLMTTFEFLGLRGRIAVHGEIDIVTAQALRSAISAATEKHDVLDLDLGPTTFLSVYGLRTLLDLKHGIGAIRIVAASPIVERVLDLTGTRAELMDLSDHIVELREPDRGRV